MVGFSGGLLGGLRGGLEVGEVEEGLLSSFGLACFFFLSILDAGIARCDATYEFYDLLVFFPLFPIFTMWG